MSSQRWTDRAAIEQWETLPRELLEAMAYDGDLAKRHLINPPVLRMLGELSGRRVLDAGCGNGYFSRLLAAAGAEVVAVEPTERMCGYAREKEAEHPLGIAYVQASLTELPDLGEPFDVVLCSMVLQAIPSWQLAMAACVDVLRPGGLFVFSVNHPAFENLASAWRQHGEYRVDRYLAEYEMPQGPYAVDWHRPLSAYLNEVARLGCRIREVAEPGLDPEVARVEGGDDPGLESYVHLPNFLIVAAERPGGRPFR